MLSSIFYSNILSFVNSVNNASISVLCCLCHPEIDHCADGTHGCEQEFMSTEDACVCKCKNSYTLRPDGKTCKSKCPLYFSTSLLIFQKRT